MLYSYFVKRLVRRSFDDVNNHRWDELLEPAVPNVQHRFGGAHAIGGERHDKETLRRWFERLGRVLPNLHLEINNIWVKGWPWHSTVLSSMKGRVVSRGASRWLSFFGALMLVTVGFLGG